jgi:hypothetical protein
VAPDPPSDGRFKPGQSGNPSGLSKADMDVRRLARERTLAAIETLAKIMLNEKAASAARVSAATALLDRGWGKPIQPSSFVDADGNDRLLPAEQASALERARRIAWLLTEGIKTLPAQQPALDTANRDHDLQRPGESSANSKAYGELSDDPEAAL